MPTPPPDPPKMIQRAIPGPLFHYRHKVTNARVSAMKIGSIQKNHENASWISLYSSDPHSGYVTVTQDFIDKYRPEVGGYYFIAGPKDGISESTFHYLPAKEFEDTYERYEVTYRPLHERLVQIQPAYPPGIQAWRVGDVIAIGKIPTTEEELAQDREDLERLRQLQESIEELFRRIYPIGSNMQETAAPPLPVDNTGK